MGLSVVIKRPSELASVRAEYAVVIDVIRATTTANVILDQPCVQELFAVDVPASLSNLPIIDGQSPLVFSEISKGAIDFERVDNSPTAAKHVSYNGRLPVLVTNNGTRALKAALDIAENVVLGAFVNIQTVVDRLVSKNPKSIVIIPSGDFARSVPHIEDECCAQSMLDMLKGKDVDFGAHSEAIWNNERILRRLSAEPYLRQDIEMCLNVDSIKNVPQASRIANELCSIRLS